MKLNFNFNFKLKKEKVFRKGGFHTNPDRWWEGLLLFTSVLALTACAYGYLLFQKVDKEPVPSEGSLKKMVEAGKIRETLGYFEERERKSGEILSSPSPFVDPAK